MSSEGQPRAGNDRPRSQVVNDINRQLVELFGRGKYREAAAIGRRLEVLIDEHDGGLTPEMAKALNSLAAVQLQLGECETAAAIHHRVLAAQRANPETDETDIALSLNNLAEAERLRGHYTEAESHFRQAQEIWRQHPQRYWRELASSLKCLAVLQQTLGRLEESESLLVEAREMWRSALGEDACAENPRYASILSNLGKARFFSGHYLEARALLERALAVEQRAHGTDDHPAVAGRRQDMAIVEEQLGAYERSESLYQRALETLRRVLGEHHRDVAKILSNLAELRLTTGRINDAENLHCQALEIKRRALGEEHPSYATSLHNLAGVYLVAGSYEKALTYATKALEVKGRVLGDDHPEVVAGHDLVGEIHLAAGRYRVAEAAFRQALARRRKALGPDHPETAKSLHPLANLYRIIGSQAEARRLCEKALELQRRALGENHPEIALSLHNLANVVTRQGKLDEAAGAYRKALDIWRSTLGEEHSHTLAARHNLGDILKLRGDYGEARTLLIEALRLERKVLGRDHPTPHRTLLSLADGCADTGDHRRAERLYRRVLRNWRQTLGDDHPDVAQVLANLAVTCAATDRVDEALVLLDEVNEIDDRMLGEVFSIVSDSQRLRYLEILRGHLDKYLSVVLHRSSAEPDAVAAAFNLILKRKALASEALMAQREAMLKDRYQALAPQLEAWASLSMEIALRAWAGPGAEGPEEHRRSLERLRERSEEIEAALARQIPEVSLERRLRGADLASVAAALPSEAVLVELVCFEPRSFGAVAAASDSLRQPSRYLAFVLAAGAPQRPHMVDLGPAAEIDHDISRLRDAIVAGGLSAREVRRRGSTNAKLHEVGERLRRRLFDPLPHLDDRAWLLLAPDGELSRLPYEVLPTEGGQYVVDRYRISYVASGRDVLRFHEASPEAMAPPLVLADPDFDLGADGTGKSEKSDPPSGNRPVPVETRRLEFPPLPGTHIEGRWVGQRLGVDPWLGPEALEAPLKQQRSPRILHIATHGFFLADQVSPTSARSSTRLVRTPPRQLPQDDLALQNPLLRAGLALAGANGRSKGFDPPPLAEDGLLTAADVAGLDLVGTDLVVLSACETGLGEVRRGEGVYGLRRAFTVAGAKTLIMSLWKVPDLATALLMDRFYAALASGRPRHEALRRAQADLREMTVGQIRARLGGAGEAGEATGSVLGEPGVRRELARLLRRPSHHRPFREPCFWGAFICQGDPGRTPPALEAKRHRALEHQRST